MKNAAQNFVRPPKRKNAQHSHRYENIWRITHNQYCHRLFLPVKHNNLPCLAHPTPNRIDKPKNKFPVCLLTMLKGKTC